VDILALLVGKAHSRALVSNPERYYLLVVERLKLTQRILPMLAAPKYIACYSTLLKVVGNIEGEFRVINVKVNVCDYLSRVLRAKSVDYLNT
jgi:hypothetical protein